MQGIEVATYTTLLTSTAEQKLNGNVDISIPKGVKQIVGIEAIMVGVTPTAAESNIGMVRLGSNDIALYNCQFLVNPSNAILGATGQMHIARSKFWPLYVPVNGGEKISLYGTALVANTVAPYMGVHIYYSDSPPVLPQRKGKVGTATSTGTSTGKVVSDAAFVVTGGSILESVYAVVANTTVVASKPIAAYAEVKSSDLLPPFPVRVPVTPVGPGLSTLISPTHDGIVEGDVLLAMASTCTMELSINVQVVAFGTAGNFVIGVVYV